MQTGDAQRRAPRPAPCRGFVYLALLGVLMLGGAGLATLGTAWSTAAQRERETELRFRGEQIRLAIARYRASGPVQAWPTSLADLAEDRRSGEPMHHLRQVWADPMTGRPDWELIEAPNPPGFAGVRSRSSAPRLTDGGLRHRRLQPDRDAPEAAPARVSDWVFVHRDAVAPAPAPSSTPSSPTPPPVRPAPPRPGRPA